jgi:hypothetical protein
MNERIRELEKQCWSHRVDGALVDGQLHFDADKFAELIVQECVLISRTSTDGFSAGRRMEEHFGVAE